MHPSAEALAELAEVSPGARAITAEGLTLLHLPKLQLPPGCTPAEVEALLCLTQHAGYPTRLFLSASYIGRGPTQNWTTVQILGKTWHTWSWNYVPADQRPIEILINHLNALR